MLAAVASSSPPPAPIWGLLKVGTKDGIKVGLRSGGVRFLTQLSHQIYPLAGLKNWLFWLLQSEYTLVEFVHSIPYRKYLSRAAWEGLHTLIRTILDNVCSEIISGRYPGLENHILMQCEYLWRGIQGRNMLPTLPERLDVPMTSLAVAEYQQWAPVCHPIVEYSKPLSEWTPRMHAASEVSKWTIPSFASFLVGAAIDVGSYLSGKLLWPNLVTGVWKELYGVVGSLAGVATFAAGWAVWAPRLLPLLPLRIQPFAPMIVPQLGMAVGGMLFETLVFPTIWPNLEVEEYPSFSAGNTLESHRRQLVYGPWRSRFPRPSSFAPISPFFIHPQLGRLYMQTVFPERVPPAETATEQPKTPEQEEPDYDDVTKLKIDLLKARRRKAQELLLTPPLTPIASEHNSSDEEDSESDSSSSSDDESDSSSSYSSSGQSESDSTSDSDPAESTSGSEEESDTESSEEESSDEESD
jgi:hypothetical protein